MNARSRVGGSRRDPRAASEPAQAPERRKRQPTGPAPVTPERLEAAALAYLARFAASSAHLTRLLVAKVRRSAHRHGTDETEGIRFVTGLVVRLQSAGLLDDQRYAEGKAFSLRRRGGSSRRVRAALAAKGITPEQAEAALVAADAERPEEDGDLAAARRFAQRRRLGPWRLRERAHHRNKDLAALGRAGFSLEVARAVIDGRAEEE